GWRCGVAVVAAAAIAAQDPPVAKPPDAAQSKSENRLAKEASPYLRQHRHNPVDWYPWGAEALARAKKEDKPIFLSIGYAACHWCHVMAGESFADPAVAAVMNEHFVCIKVDREERPDIDEIYMAALQAMGQQGGWPLSAWLTPDGRPFYGGTYFPPEDAHGRPGFRRVLEALAKAWREQKQEVSKQADGLADHLRTVLAPKVEAGEPTVELLAKVLPQSEQRFDAQHGGFAHPPRWAPKFPHASELQALLRLPGEKALDIAQRTLAAMRSGGIYDQLGGGFHRYSTDRQWLVPHFEKMLYDNALLAPCYLDAFARTGDADHAVVARETLDYLLREMRHERSGFYSSQDAQSEGVEGRFFVWSKAEFDAVLGDLAEIAGRHFGVTADGNWEHTNVLVLAHRAEALAAPNTALDATRARLQQARTALFAAREKRVHPGTDDKVLCAWNGLALGALAAGYRHLGEERYLDAARKLADFLLAELVVEGRCRRSWHGGIARHQGYLEDYTMLADGLVSLFEVDADPRWLAASRDLLQRVRKHFLADDGGFWFTADDHEQLLARTKSASESSTPSGTAAAVRACLRAGLLLGDEQLYGMGVAALRANHALLQHSPVAAPSLVVALQFHLAGPQEVVIAGEPQDERTKALLSAAWRAFPDHHVTALVHEGNRKALAALSKVFDGKGPVGGVPAAWVCRRGVCAAPVTDPAKLIAGLGAARPGTADPGAAGRGAGK
ncbi:MAG TPA: thioredoxin domain-containing protein, partial [Planctomycetota bacterium]